MINKSKKNEQRFWDKWKSSGAIADFNGNPVPGEAYAFFDCNASPTEITEEMPTIRRLAKTPKNLKTILSDARSPIPFSRGVLDKELIDIAKEAVEIGRKYFIYAFAPANMTNRQVAGELMAILNQAYQSPLYENGEEFYGNVVHKERDGYVFN
jgi:hypothetical protein